MTFLDLRPYEQVYMRLAEIAYANGGHVSVLNAVDYDKQPDWILTIGTIEQLGVKQFRTLEGRGKWPENPTTTFFYLRAGDRMFKDLTVTYRLSYYEGDTRRDGNFRNVWPWEGWYQIWLDYEGNRWMLPYIFNWHKTLKEDYPWLDWEHPEAVDISDRYYPNRRGVR